MKLPMPVGRVEFMYMYPMNFKEFLVAINHEKLVTYIQEYDFTQPFSEDIHNQIQQYRQ